MTYREAMEILSDSGVENGGFEAALLFSSILGIGMSSIPLLGDRDFESDALALAVKRRAEGYPLQYILGEWEFYGLPFEVCEDCLCPRPDTEVLVETAIKLIPPGGRFLELCTGSGCIPVSICKNRPDTRGIATDLFERTLGVAIRNASRNGVSDKIEFLLADVFDLEVWENGRGRELIPDGGFDAIVSNPPYIPTAHVESLSREVKHEPRAALDGGEDGLDFYRFIVGEYLKYLSDDGVLIFEIGYDQGDALCKIAEENKCSCRVIKDLGGNDRVTVIKKYK